MAVVGNNLYRINTENNKHSCTPGINGSEAMCVSYDLECNYIPENERSIRIDVSVLSTGDEPVVLNELKFYEKAPLMFDWIDGQ